MPGALSMYVICDHPSDYPEYFTVRRLWMEGGKITHAQHCDLAKTLEEARAFLPPGGVNIGREPHDDPVIVESWVY